MDALISAGGIPKPDEPLYSLTKGRPKALLEIAGKPIVQWVIDAVSSAANIDRIVLVGLSDRDGLESVKPIRYLPNQGGLLDNVVTGAREVLKLNPEARFVLSASSDIPAVTPEMVEWIVDTAESSNYDFYYTVITRDAMEMRYPDSRRSYLRLKDYELCGGDMNVFRASLVNRQDDLAQKIIESRKNPFRQAAMIGFDSLLLLLLRRLTLEAAVKRVGKRFDVQGKAVVCPYPEIGMDVDKPFQYDILAADLQARTAS
jgi:GTP:adenosylcobinamide-phosphate guanylyltransferase